MLRYPCLVLDHDDTVMDSTKDLHYPAFLDAMNQLRPGTLVTLQEYFLFNFRPGFTEYCRNVLRLTDEEMERELAIWESWTDRVVPRAYPGMAKIIRRQVREGGTVCVVSHSLKRNILRDYKANSLPQPMLVYGWERPPEERKPSAFPLLQIMKELQLQPKDLLMVDDMDLGYDMAQKCGVNFAAAGWAYDVKEIKDSLKARCPLYFDTPAALENYLYEGENKP